MKSFLTPPRKIRSELLDEGAGTLEDVRHSLNDLNHLNRYLGGVRAVLTHLSPHLKTQSDQVKILDIGTGDAALLNKISDLGKKKEYKLNLFGLDLMARHLSIAQNKTHFDNSLHLVQANSLNLPFPDSSLDYVICSLLVHHLTRSQVIQLLKEAYRCVRSRIIISDLVRGWLPLIGYKLIQPIFNLHPITQHDGETSILRAFTLPELAEISIQAGLLTAKIYRHPMFRMTLVVDK